LHIMHKANLSCSVLKGYLEFLIAKGLVEKRTMKKHRIVYADTERGLTVLKYFRELKLALPIVEEDGRNIPPFY